ncbi:MAG: hypothetical protein HZB46_07990 [Solirubrobacterales bacterium]|nr:hypothetical protein [Solirubrobacterales bacterium]
MTIGPEHEAPRAGGEGAGDAVTVAFADDAASLCGVARVGLAVHEGARVASGLGVLFADGQPVAVRAEGGVTPDGEDWSAVEAAGVHTEVLEPLRAWRVTFTDEEGRNGFDLRLRAVSEPASLGADVPAGKLGGMEGYDQLVEVEGTLIVDGAERPFRGRGQRGHSWGAPDWDKLSMARTIGVWLSDATGVSITAVRPAKASSHADEAIHAVLLAPADESSSEAVATVVDDPRLSTTYDGEGRQRSAGLELYVHDDDNHALRVAGEVACGTSLDLGRLTLDTAFFTWRMEGRTGVGRYDVLRRANGAA